MRIDAPNLNFLWSALLVEELVRQGVELFCISPGSRSTPLTLAAAENPRARTQICLDERGAAFYALGYARASGRPAALVCTSGTAVANYFPALIEASVDCVPMLVLSADRPPELRETAANQTIRQPGIFGDYIRWQFDLPCPTLDVPPEAVLTTAAQAVHRTLRSPAGPVHLNCMFREPLAPTPVQYDRIRYLQTISAWLERDDPFSRYAPHHAIPDDSTLEEIAAALRAERGCLVAGHLRSENDRAAVAELAGKLRWPLFADATSGLRNRQATGSTAIAGYDLLLQGSTPQPPEVIVQFGSRITSKRLLQALERWRPETCIVVENNPFRVDPVHLVRWRFDVDIAAFCRALTAILEPAPSNNTYLERWCSTDAKVQKRLDRFFAGQQVLSEPLVARLVCQNIPAGTALFLASSMPVRDVDMFSGHLQPGYGDASTSIRVTANRGTSGIDGTIAAAAGSACGHERPVTVLIGDLALLHDLNSLHLVRELTSPVAIVVLNNDGGGIFSFLPIAAFETHFEKYFGTPHGRRFRAAAEMFGLAYANPGTVAEFLDAYRDVFAGGHSALIEINTERRENVRLHKAIVEFLAMAQE